MDKSPKRILLFLKKFYKTSKCWIWTGAVNSCGYGNFWDGEHYCNAHNYSYRLFVGPIEKGLHVDHLCRNRICVNPDHLEAVTQRENLLRGNTLVSKESKQTHCINDHEFNFKNTYIDKRNRRHCRKCRCIRLKKHRNRNKND